MVSEKSRLLSLIRKLSDLSRFLRESSSGTEKALLLRRGFDFCVHVDKRLMPSSCFTDYRHKGKVGRCRHPKRRRFT